MYMVATTFQHTKMARHRRPLSRWKACFQKHQEKGATTTEIIEAQNTRTQRPPILSNRDQGQDPSKTSQQSTRLRERSTQTGRKRYGVMGNQILSPTRKSPTRHKRGSKQIVQGKAGSVDGGAPYPTQPQSTNQVENSHFTPISNGCGPPAGKGGAHAHDPARICPQERPLWEKMGSVRDRVCASACHYKSTFNMKQPSSPPPLPAHTT